MHLDFLCGSHVPRVRQTQESRQSGDRRGGCRVVNPRSSGSALCRVARGFCGQSRVVESLKC
jgi:hypothetical protein